MKDTTKAIEVWDLRNDRIIPHSELMELNMLGGVCNLLRRSGLEETLDACPGETADYAVVLRMPDGRQRMLNYKVRTARSVDWRERRSEDMHAFRKVVMDSVNPEVRRHLEECDNCEMTVMRAYKEGFGGSVANLRMAAWEKVAGLDMAPVFGRISRCALGDAVEGGHVEDMARAHLKMVAAGELSSALEWASEEQDDS
ncbi:hypothetical protein CENSYa_1029 [Cenarchaeum symbiosum A]|uniref:Uncharacterized protein n=1 Tax=Cenarchaeum symbiosum (strain A) TaxID=414004 RepID=A0RWE3_CENSY|nr:hypothetical protein CENSYa_1029 [Cenarchaeum symbiosum A]